MQALQLLADDLASGVGMSVNVFLNEYCAPLKTAEIWVMQKRRHYGALAELPAFTRVEQWLRSGPARIEVLRCMRSGCRLEGNSQEYPGIEQCRALVAELDNLRERSAGPSQFRAVSSQYLPVSSQCLASI